jgi:hypothetical protein
MADPCEYVSKSKLEYHYGYRHAYLKISWSATVRTGDQVLSLKEEESDGPSA